MSVLRTAGILLVFAVLALAAAGGPFPPAKRAQETRVPAPPGLLCAVHAERPGMDDCEACHGSPGEIAPERCLACHDEIATCVAEGRGYHRDKAEGCGTCHTEHRGPDAKLVPLDPGDFDHDETGFVLEGGHARVKGCGSCHEGAAAVRRSTGRSYLLLDSRCSACHVSPHPGRQEECLACHSMDGWRSAGSPTVR